MPFWFGINVTVASHILLTQQGIRSLRQALAIYLIGGSRLSPAVLRPVLGVLNDDHGLGLDLGRIEDEDVATRCVWALKQKGGLHRHFVDSLPRRLVPPLATSVLTTLKGDAAADPLITLDVP